MWLAMAGVGGAARPSMQRIGRILELVLLDKCGLRMTE